MSPEVSRGKLQSRKRTSAHSKWYNQGERKRELSDVRRSGTGLFFITGGVQQLAGFGGISHVDLHHPAFPVRILVHQLRIGIQLLIQLQYFSRTGHEQV